MTTPERAGLEAVIGQLEKNWHTESAHQALLDYANEKGLLPDAARFYRENIENAERRERCEQKLAAIQVLALSQLERTKRTSRAPRRLKKWLGLVLVAIFLGCLMTFLKLLLS